MKVLVIGGGGREHALVWALSKSKLVEEIHVAPGNAGMRGVAFLHSVHSEGTEEILDLATQIDPDLIIIGPEAPLVKGAADSLRNNGFTVFGPGKTGAALEGSKAFAKQFMSRWNIPTAPFHLCTTLEEGMEALKKRHAPYVIKADGLAAGKGAFVVGNLEDAQSIISDLLVKKTLGAAGEKIIVEDYMPGLELTVLCVSDGKEYRILPPSQDHKRVYDNDKGPNTGGMGAYCPVPWAGSSLMERIEKEVISPTFEGLKKEGIPYCGVLYFGLMIDSHYKPRVVEYNVRFGDPEAQVILPVLNVDFAQLAMAASTGALSTLPPIVANGWAVDVVISSEGYPGPYKKGLPISGLHEAAALRNVLLFHSGTSLNQGGETVTNGGRVLNIVGLGLSLEDALARSYEGVKYIHFEGAHYRRDIAAKARI